MTAAPPKRLQRPPCCPLCALFAAMRELVHVQGGQCALVRFASASSQLPIGNQEFWVPTRAIHVGFKAELTVQFLEACYVLWWRFGELCPCVIRDVMV